MTIKLEKAIDLNGTNQIEKALITLNTEGSDKETNGTKSNTTIRIGRGDSTVNPTLEVNIHSKYQTKFASMEDWKGNSKNAKIYLNYDSQSGNSNFVIIVCSYANNSEKQNKQYLININDIAFIQIKFRDKNA